MKNAANQEAMQLGPLEATYAQLSDKINMPWQAVYGFVLNTLAAANGGRQPTADAMLEYATLCLQTGLNPIIKSEVAPLVQGNRVSLIVMRDGWVKLRKSQADYDGMDFVFSEDTVTSNGHKVPAWIECRLYEKGRSRPFVWRTPFDEAFVSTSPVWKKEPTNMLQIRAMIRAIRNCYGLAVYSPEEAVDFEGSNPWQGYEVPQVAAPEVPPQNKIAQKKTSRSRVSAALQNKAAALENKAGKKTDANEMLRTLHAGWTEPEPVPVQAQVQAPAAAQERAEVPANAEEENLYADIAQQFA